MGAGRIRLAIGPPLIWIREMYRVSTSTLGDFCWALAMAERRTFSRMALIFFRSLKRRMVRASPT